MDKTFHIDAYEIPKWLYKLLIFIRIGRIYALPEEKEKVLDDMIENGQLRGAKKYLEYLERKYGVSTLTVKYSARISRIEVLGK